MVRGPEATSQTWVVELNSFLVSFPIRVLLSASNKQTLALFSCNILKMDTKMWKHTQLRYVIILAREAAQPPAPDPQECPFLSSWLLAWEEGILEISADSLASLQSRHSTCTWGAPDQGCRVRGGQCCLCLLSDRHSQGVLHVGTAKVPHGRLPGCLGTGPPQRCV